MSERPATPPAILPVAPAPRSLYIHVPFCARVCPYCDFVKLAPPDSDAPRRFMDALLCEAAARIPVGARYETIFIGGGTPTELPSLQLERLLELTGRCAAPGAEITIEANPGTADAAVFAQLAAGGVTRVSIGVQSMNDDLLRRLGRIHDSRANVRAVEDARAAGIESINVDLIHSGPDQTLDDLARDLDRLIELAPGHVSAYCLTHEPGTPFGRAVASGALVPATSELEADMMLMVRERLGDAGFEPYEISNYAGAAGVCRHNLLTWQYERYEAIGPGAAAFVGWQRRGGARSLQRWQESSGSTVEFIENIDAETALREVLMLGLRLERGVTRREIGARAGATLDHEREQTLAALVSRGLIEDDGERIALSDRGRLLASHVTLELF